MKDQILTNFSRWREAELDRDAHIIVASMTNNPHFLMLADKTTALATAADAYRDAIAGAAHRGNEAMAHKRRQREGVIKALKALGVLVNLEADGDHDMLESSGFPFARPRVSRRVVSGPIDVEAGDGAVSVALMEHPDAMGYLVQYTEAPVTGESTWTDVFSSTLTLVVSGLAPDRKYAFRVAPLVHLTAPVFCEPVITKYVD